VSVRFLLSIFIAAACVAYLLGPQIWHAIPRTHSMSREEYSWAVEKLFPGAKLPPSARIENCAKRESAAGKDLNVVIGCSLSLDPREFDLLVDSAELIGSKPAMEVSASFPTPEVGKPFSVAQVYYSSPPENWTLYGRLMFVDCARTRVAAYVRLFAVVD
jgi:hypothetical protein